MAPVQQGIGAGAGGLADAGSSATDLRDQYGGRSC